MIMAGVATDIGLLHAALGAKAAGFEAITVLDASGTTDPQAEELARLRLTQEGVGLTGWASLAAGLMGDFAGPHSLDKMALLSQRMDTAGGPFG
jgi:nicotinamidase-related amidase